jgi:hypothetical protein
MSAAVMVRAPLGQEALAFWEDLIGECDRYTSAINAAISSQGVPPDQFLECGHEHELHMRKSTPPSPGVRMAIDFLSWGPVIRGRVTGQETKDSEFCVEEWEVPIAKDLDGAVIAIFDEGRSFSPQELARYVVQTFRPCYPAISLPCERNPRS